MSDYSAEALMAVVMSSAAVFLWAVLIGRCLSSPSRLRATQTTMYLVGLLASIGSFASAWGFAMTVDGLSSWPDIDPLVVTVTASVGRGALLMGGAILLAIGSRTRSGE